MADEKPKTADQVEDKNLEDLLDSALEDFNDPSKDTEVSDESGGQTDIIESPQIDEDWTKDFMEQAANQFEKDLQTFIKNGTESELGASFEKMARTVASAMTDTNDKEGSNVNTDFQSVIAQALQDLSVTTEDLQKESDLAAMFGQASSGEGAGDIFPLMQGMMQSLLSKEILYPLFKELVEKYPTWLEEKKDTLSDGDNQRYTKQLELMQKICTELEKEKDDDTEEIKKRRFETISSLMHEMYTCGQPPEDLVGKQPPFFQFDPDSDLAQNCRLM